MTRTLDAIADGGTRARWMTTLVDLAALILSMFVLILATRSLETPRAPTSEDVPPPASAPPSLEPGEPATTARVSLLLALLRERLRDAALDGRVSVRAARDGLVLDLTGGIALSLAEPTVPDPEGSLRSLATLLHGLEPEVFGATLTYAGRGTAHVEDDLRRADRAAAYLAQLGLRPGPEPVLTPTAVPGRPPFELRLTLASP